MHKSKKILVAPLNWGLGHATRCIPIILELQRQGAEVILAADGQALDLLKKEFPSLSSVELPAYDIAYPSWNMVWSVALQLPKILRAVYLENRCLKKLVTRFQLDGVISDNRYGCYYTGLPSVFLTHQVNIKTPYHALTWVVNTFNHYLIQRFSACWIPDMAGEINLSGKLSRPVFKGIYRYIGALSRMKSFDQEKKYDAIAVLSGPEPQRTYLEQVIIRQASALPYGFLIVQGKTERKERFFLQKNIEVASFLTTAELNEAMLASRIFIGRSGYSTLMDLAKLGMKAVLIPTPGQTEQEYLAEKCRQGGVFFIQRQRDLDLKKAMEFADAYPGLQGSFFDEKALRDVVSWLITQ